MLTVHSDSYQYPSQTMIGHYQNYVMLQRWGQAARLEEPEGGSPEDDVVSIPERRRAALQYILCHLSLQWIMSGIFMPDLQFNPHACSFQ